MLRGRRGTTSSTYVAYSVGSISRRCTRNEVYAAVDSEREYQEDLEPSLTQQDRHTIPGELVLMKVYLDRAMEAWVNPRNDIEAALNHIRKIAGIAVRCMENHGAPPRMVPREVNMQKTPTYSNRADSRSAGLGE